MLQRPDFAWDWERLSANPHLPWSAAWIAPQAASWNWATLSSQKQLPWNAELFGAFAEHWFVPLLSEHQHFGVATLSQPEVQGLLGAMAAA